MRFWDLSGPEIEALDAEPWDMPLSSAMRPFPMRSIVRLYVGGVVLYGGTGLSGVGYAFAARDEAADGATWIGFQCVTIGMALLTLCILALTPARALRRSGPVVSLTLLGITPALVGWGFVGTGPGFALLALAFVQAPLFAFYMLRLPWAIAQG